MKYYLSLLLASILLLGSCSRNDRVYFFTSFHEPADEGLRMLYSFDGYNWTDLDTVLLKPEVGNQKVMRDPSIVRGPDGTYHLVWTSSWRGDLGFGYASSKDLLHWSEQKFIPVMAFDTSTVNVWAPELFYEDETGEFFIIWASTIPYKFEKGIEEERNNHRMYYTVTKDFETFSETKLFLDPGFSVIDAVIVKRGHKDYVLVLKDNTRPERDIKVAFSDSPHGPWHDVSDAFSEQFTEGPTVVKVGDEFLVYYDAYRKKTYDASKTSDFIHFTDASGEVSIPEGHKHGTIFIGDRKTLDGLLYREKSLVQNEDSVFYSGSTLVNVDYHNGQLPLARGVHNIQVLRASREHPEMADEFGWTYNHAPNLAWWNQTFFLQYLSDPVGEHIPPGQSFLVTSHDGYHWKKPIVAFPQYKIPDGTGKEGETAIAKNLTAVMHQRMGFFVSGTNRLLMLGYYGISLHAKDGPNDGKGIGRVVREIYEDGSLGPVYFIRINKGREKTAEGFPFFTESDDEGFVGACNEILSDPLQLQQWNEEADRDDPIIPQTKEYKAFCYYTLPDNRIVGLWKNGLYEINTNGGKSWEHIKRAPGFVTKNAKIWGQATPDGKFLTVYNPSEFRWPLALSVSENGLEYNNLLLVNGEITTMRYGGNYKSYGPQYVRGIQEHNPRPSDNSAWVSYSMNKEDIWISRIPVPVVDRESDEVAEEFQDAEPGMLPAGWNIFSPVMARVAIEKADDKNVLTLHDSDPFDYAKAERLFPAKETGFIEFELVPGQHDYGMLQVELQDHVGTAAIRLVFGPDGKLSVKDGYRMSEVVSYKAGEPVQVKIDFNTRTRMYNVYINGENKKTRLFFAPVHTLERLTFRTGEVRRFPDADTPTDQDFDVPNAGAIEKEAIFMLYSLKTGR